MASNVLPKTFRNHNNFNCDRIFRAKHQLSLIPLNRTAALSAEQLNSPRILQEMPDMSESAVIDDYCIHFTQTKQQPINEYEILESL